jgi:hypothetical protein
VKRTRGDGMSSSGPESRPSRARTTPLLDRGTSPTDGSIRHGHL